MRLGYFANGGPSFDPESGDGGFSGSFSVWYDSDGTIHGYLPETSAASYTIGDIIGVVYDLDAGNFYFYKNGAYQGTTGSPNNNGWIMATRY